MQLAKILVVDDEPDLEFLILQKFRGKINSKEYEFLFARDGSEALTIIQNNKNINLVLTDINMPVMDGLTLLSKMNEIAQNKFETRITRKAKNGRRPTVRSAERLS